MELCAGLSYTPLQFALIAVLITVAVGKLYTWLRSYRDYVNTLNKLPHRPQHWLWGNLHTHPGIRPGCYEYANDWVREFPRIYVEWFGPFNALVSVHHPDTVKKVLKTSEPKSDFYQNLRPWLGDGLLISTDRKWKRNRRLLTGAFHFDILRPYMDVNNKCTDMFVQNLSRYADTQETFELFGAVSLLTLEVILKCAFSYHVDCQKPGSENEYIKSVFRLSHIINKRTFEPWLANEWLYIIFGAGLEQARHCRIVNKVANTTIQQRKEILRNDKEATKKSKCLDFLDILLTARDSDGNGLSDVEIRDEVNTFLFAGHDTTSSGITWALYLLAEHPEYQTKCQEEIDGVLRGKQSLDWDDLSKLEFTTMCLKECMRVSCTVPFIGRKLTQDMRIDDFLLPKGTNVDVRIWHLHHNGAVWEDEHIFRPERFAPDKIDKMDPYAFVPFSAGPRNCIGQHFAMHEMKTVLARALHRYTWSIDWKRKAHMIPSLVQKAADGVYVSVKHR